MDADYNKRQSRGGNEFSIFLGSIQLYFHEVKDGHRRSKGIHEGSKGG